MESKHSDNFDGILTVTLKPKSQKSREHLILQGCYRMTMETIPKVGFARAFDLTGGKHICLHFKSTWLDILILIHCIQKSVKPISFKTGTNVNFTY